MGACSLKAKTTRGPVSDDEVMKMWTEGIDEGAFVFAPPPVECQQIFDAPIKKQKSKKMADFASALGSPETAIPVVVKMLKSKGTRMQVENAINKAVDIPMISEETEGKIIKKVLKIVVKVLEQMIEEDSDDDE